MSEKNLITLLEISEQCPADFYTNKTYIDQTRQAVDDEGRKKAESDAAAIRKLVRTTNCFTKNLIIPENNMSEKNLITLLEISEQCPADFYTNKTYIDQTRQAVSIAKTMVHTIDDEGRKKAASDAAAIRKFVITTNRFTKSTFDKLTGRIKDWRDLFTTETKELSKAADDIIKKFETMEREKLLEIERLILIQLRLEREEKYVREEFITNPNITVTLSGWITPQNRLTKKSNDMIFNIVSAELEQQRTYDRRCNDLKIRCLEEEIAPFSPDILGDAMFTKSEDVFLFKLNSLIDMEKERIENAAAKQRAKIEAEKAEAVAKALKEQDSNRIATEKASPETPIKITEQRTADIAPADGTRLVRYVVTYQARIKSSTTNEQFKAMIDKEVTQSGRALKAILSAEVSNVE